MPIHLLRVQINLGLSWLQDLLLMADDSEFHLAASNRYLPLQLKDTREWPPSLKVLGEPCWKTQRDIPNWKISGDSGICSVKEIERSVLRGWGGEWLEIFKGELETSFQLILQPDHTWKYLSYTKKDLNLKWPKWWGWGVDVHVAKLKIRLDKKYLFRILTLNKIFVEGTCISLPMSLRCINKCSARSS